MIETLRLGVCDAPARRNSHLGNENGAAGVMAHQVAEIARVRIGTLTAAMAPVSGVEDQEVRVVRVDVIRGEQARGEGRGRDHALRIDGGPVVVVNDALEAAARAAQTLEDPILLLARGLGRMHERVQRRPVREGNRAGLAVGFRFVRGHGLERRCDPGLHARPRFEADVPALEALRAVRTRDPIECAHRERLPLPSQDDAEQPGRGVGLELAQPGAVPGEGVAGTGSHLDIAVNGIDHTADLVCVLPIPVRLVESVVGRKLDPDALDEIQRCPGVGAILHYQSAVENGRKQRVHAHDVRVHRADFSEPVAVDVFVNGKLGGELSREGDPHVHPLDEQGDPRLTLVDLEVPRAGAKRHLHGRRGSFRRPQAAVLECGPRPAGRGQRLSKRGGRLFIRRHGGENLAQQRDRLVGPLRSQVDERGGLESFGVVRCQLLRAPEGVLGSGIVSRLEPRVTQPRPPSRA